MPVSRFKAHVTASGYGVVKMIADRVTGYSGSTFLTGRDMIN